MSRIIIAMTKAAMREAARSGNKTCPICKGQFRLVEHHIAGRDIPNAEAQWNRIYICPSCHDLVHSGDTVVEGTALTSDGNELIWHKKGEPNKFLEAPPVNGYRETVGVAFGNIEGIKKMRLET